MCKGTACFSLHKNSDPKSNSETRLFNGDTFLLNIHDSADLKRIIILAVDATKDDLYVQK